MYNEHFGLKRSPFRITPDTKLFYPGGSRGEILEALIYAVTSGEGIVKVVGEVGSGKTMLCRMLEERLAGKVDIVYLANPSLSPEDTLHAIALEMKLDVDPEANRLQVMHALQQRLLEKHADNRQVVVFVEEAQSMPIATLEEIRLLSNLETNRDKLLQIVLFGQPELDENLGKAEIRQLNERITHSFYLQAFTPEQMREYVNFRMRAVGYRGPDIFRGGAYRRMAKASEGLTRRINILADKALLAAFAEDTFDVGKRHVKFAINESQFSRHRRWRLPEISLLSGLVLIAAALVWAFVQRSDALGEGWRTLLPGGARQDIAEPAASPQPTPADAAASVAAA
ncbi:MAG: AAA family ATPase, partial [Gammaproteobacteria bacterium]